MPFIKPRLLLSLTLGVYCLTAIGFQAIADISRETSTTTISNEASELRLPPKPAALTAVPLAKLVVDAPGAGVDLAPALNSYVTELFTRAQRPRITESDKFNFLIRATLVTPPEITMVSKKGKGWNPFESELIKRLTGGWKNLSDFSGLKFGSTNIVMAIRCSVEMRLLNQDREVLAVRNINLVRTNNLRALSVELSGFRTGGTAPDDIESYLKNLTGGAMRQAVANLAAYHGTTNLLADADLKFLEPGAAAPVNPPVSNEGKGAPTPVESSAPPVAAEKSEWLTPKEAADILKVTEADLLSAVEKGEIKARKIGSVIRIRREDLN
jgi:excisionase family DNA binding protein